MQFEYDQDDLAGSCASVPARPAAFQKRTTPTGIPTRVILDLTTPLEAFTGILTVVALAGTAFMIVLAIGDSGADARREWGYALICGLTAIIGGLLWFFTDCYYVIDGRQKRFLYHFSFLGHTQETEVARFDQIRELAVDGWERYHKGGKYSRGYYYWVYALMVVLRDGSRIRVSNETREPFTLTPDAQKAAGVVGCEFVGEGHANPYSFFNFW